MNNGEKNSSIDSNINNQIIQYNIDGIPVNGMRFMYKPLSGKLSYSRGIIFLIFGHYNNFLETGGHQGDSVVIFDDVLQDLDFGCSLGTTHSLIQSAIFDEYYFWTASLGDGYPERINVMFTSKINISSDFYDPINKKYNQRYYDGLGDLAVL